jgi:hypothetical protein
MRGIQYAAACRFGQLMSLEYWIVRSSAQLRTRRTITVENAAPSHAIADMRLTSAPIGGQSAAADAPAGSRGCRASQDGLAMK